MAQKLTSRRTIMRYLWGRTTPATSSEISAKVGLNARQVGSVLRPLVAQGLVEIDPTSSPNAYRPVGASTSRDAR